MNAFTNAVSASAPGAQSLTSETTFLLPFFAAHSPMIIEDWPSVKLVRTMKGERSTVIDAPEMITTVGILACVTSWVIASAVGVIPPSTILTFSLTIISCTTRRARPGRRVLAHDQLDLLAGDPVAVELHVELGAGERLAADGLEAAGQRQASADLDDILRGCVAHSGGSRCTRGSNSLQHVPAQHVSLPILLLIQAVGRQA